MDRLTKRKRNNDGSGISTDSLIVENGMRKGFPSSHCGRIVTKLAEYEDMDEQGLILRLPCKVGDAVYILAGRFGTFYEEDICDGFFVGKDGTLQVKTQNYKGNHGTYGEVGKTLFLNREEAEAALKKVN
jgi:hypothetical protein|nr:MAG TPA: hypothetical protein [Caudoviricetes sp.]